MGTVTQEDGQAGRAALSALVISERETDDGMAL